ncbi:hypothetical protein ACFYOA_08180 [Streptomyces iakyrus]|uniref:hypothetical protein n=1 Tax=Streptomyces iakyrus TaxID=68219 RepID=UPI003679C1AE
MSSLAWFQDGVGYGAAELSDWHDRMIPKGSFRHLLRSTTEFLGTADTALRTVTVAAGSVLMGGTSSGGTWAWSSGQTVPVPVASSDNPRKDLVVARLTTAAVDGANGLIIELVQGTPAAVPVVPARPANSIGLYVVDVPKAQTTFTISGVRYGGVFTDQAVFAGGLVAIDWQGQLPAAAGFPVGFALYDIGRNQRWVRRGDGQTGWFTTDFGPWVQCTLLDFQNGDGTNVNTDGELWVRESSAAWEFSGRVDFSPGFNANGLVSSIASVPNTITRPDQHTYASVAQSWASNKSGNARMAYTTTGGVELGIDTQAASLYVNVQLSKSPWNT